MGWDIPPSNDQTNSKSGTPSVIDSNPYWSPESRSVKTSTTTQTPTQPETAPPVRVTIEQTPPVIPMPMPRPADMVTPRVDTTYQGQSRSAREVYGAAPGSMTYSAMRQASGYDSQQPGSDRLGANLPPPERGLGLLAGLGRRRQQPQPVQEVKAQPPGQPEAQQRQGIFRRPLRGDQPPAQPKAEPLQKIDLTKENDGGIVGELNLPARFKEQKVDPNDGSLVRKEYKVDNSPSKVTIYEGRELDADQQKALGAILARPGRLGPSRNAAEQARYDNACALIMSGTTTSFPPNNPMLSVVTINGRNSIVLEDRDPQQKLSAYTVFTPSDKGKFLYAIGSEGSSADVALAKQSINAMKRKSTPDAVAPPVPGPNNQRKK
ncbi:MAG: hypothetical protein K2X93_21460 [Candidatus Obscuribacterales bacterium]|nr:hypothetical protein [Candidatus Obscuribacterales bacterium]